MINPRRLFEKAFEVGLRDMVVFFLHKVREPRRSSVLDMTGSIAADELLSSQCGKVANLQNVRNALEQRPARSRIRNSADSASTRENRQIAQWALRNPLISRTA